MLNRVLYTHLLLALLVCGLASCGTTTPKDAADQAHSSAQPSGPSAKKLLAEARASDSPLREQLTLQAVERLLMDGDVNYARNLLSALDSETLGDDLYLTHTELTGRLALREGSYLFAQDILTAPRLEQQWITMEPATEARLRELRAQVFMRLGDVTHSVNERITLAALLTDEVAAQDNQDGIWRSLTSLS